MYADRIAPVQNSLLMPEGEIILRRYRRISAIAYKLGPCRSL